MSETLTVGVINAIAVICAAILTVRLSSNVADRDIKWIAKELYDRRGNVYTAIFVKVRNPQQKETTVKLTTRNFSIFKFVTDVDLMCGPCISMHLISDIVKIPPNGEKEILFARVLDSSDFASELHLIRDYLEISVQKCRFEKLSNSLYFIYLLRSSKLLDFFKYGRKKSISIPVAEVMSNTRKRLKPFTTIEENDIWERLFMLETKRELKERLTKAQLKKAYQLFSELKYESRSQRREIVYAIKNLDKNMISNVLDFCLLYIKDRPENETLNDLRRFLYFEPDAIYDLMLQNSDIGKNRAVLIEKLYERINVIESHYEKNLFLHRRIAENIKVFLHRFLWKHSKRYRTYITNSRESENNTTNCS